jgi:hypothetical protein
VHIARHFHFPFAADFTTKDIEQDLDRLLAGESRSAQIGVRAQAYDVNCTAGWRRPWFALAAATEAVISQALVISKCCIF